MTHQDYRHMVVMAKPDWYAKLKAGESQRHEARADWLALNAEANRMVKFCYLQNSEAYRDLWKLKTLAWSATSPDVDSADEDLKPDNFQTYVRIFEEMDQKIKDGVLPEDSTGEYSVLDICMASGGFTHVIHQRLPHANICGITLAEFQGGLPVDTSVPYAVNNGMRKKLSHRVETHQRGGAEIQVHFNDITFLYKEFVDKLYLDHPKLECFSFAQPYHGEAFDLVLADGEVLHQKNRKYCYRQLRLLAAEIVLGFTRVKEGGTFVIGLEFHEQICYELFHLITTMRKFASIHMYKPSFLHKDRSFVYVVAKSWRARTDQLLQGDNEQHFRGLLQRWRHIWELTMSYERNDDERSATLENILNVSEEQVHEELYWNGWFLASILTVPMDMQKSALRHVLARRVSHLGTSLNQSLSKSQRTTQSQSGSNAPWCEQTEFVAKMP